jgi:hypothetical protein
MFRSFSVSLIVLACAAIARAQDIVPVHHAGHAHATPAAAGSCATCGTCADCVRITEIKKTQVPVYSVQIKEICVPNHSLFGHLFGHSGDCRKIEVKQLVKKYRTEEECVTRCVTAEEAAKHYEAEAKKAAANIKEATPVPAPLPAPLPTPLPAPPTSLPPAPVNRVEPVSSTAAGGPQRILPTGYSPFRKN